MSLTEILEKVEKLTPSEKQKVRSMLDADQAVEVSSSVLERQELLVKKLYDQGIIKSIPRRSNRSRVSQPVPIEGKPLSETTIEDRR